MLNEIVIDSEDQVVKQGKEISIDWFSVTFEFRCNDEERELDTVIDTVEMIRTFLNYPKERIVERNYGKRNYRYAYDFGDYISLNLCGPINDRGVNTNSLVISGQGCDEFETINGKDKWPEFIKNMIVRLQGTCTRIDLPIDDFEGDVISFDYLKNKLDREMYTSTFKKEYVISGNKTNGYSLTFGQRRKDIKTSSQLVIYEKNKEQNTKGETCLQDYWVRYEMRFMHEKAQRIALAILDVYEFGIVKLNEEIEVPKNEEGFVILVSTLLYGMLDIKEENNYSKDNISKANIDPKWKEFLGQVERGKVTSGGNKVPSWNKFNKYINQVLPIYEVSLFIKAGQNIKEYNRMHLKMLSEYLAVIPEDKKKINRLNVFMEEMGINKIDIKTLLDNKDLIEEHLQEEELPF